MGCVEAHELRAIADSPRWRGTCTEGAMMTEVHGTLQVTGTGRVAVTPDEAVVHLGVVTDGKTAAEAVAGNAKRTQALIDAVSVQPNHGVTTLGLSVTPIISYDPGTNVGTIVGFRATNGVEVKTKIGHAGQLYDVGITAGATQSSGITFRVQHEAPHREEALRIAVAEAYKEASIVAKTARVDLEGATSIQIDSGGGRVLYRASAVDVKAMATPVTPDDMSIAASVQIQFRTRTRA